MYANPRKDKGTSIDILDQNLWGFCKLKIIYVDEINSENQRDQVRLQKRSCQKSKNLLFNLKEIKRYNGGFECDNCAATNLISCGFSMIFAEGARKGC